MTDQFLDVLKILTDNDGACLYWQMPYQARAMAAVNAGIVKMVGDLIVHPEAVATKEGEAYTMSICSRCGILIRPEGGHRCGSCGRDI